MINLRLIISIFLFLFLTWIVSFFFFSKFGNFLEISTKQFDLSKKLHKFQMAS